MARNPVKDLLESSPWALGAVAAAALVACVLTALQLGLRIAERAGTGGDAPVMEIARLGRFMLVPATPAMQKIALVRSVQELSSGLAGAEGNRVPLWPVELQVLNPGRDALNLHGCRMRLTLPLHTYKGVKVLSPLESAEYFLTDALAGADAQAAGKPVQIAPGEAKRVPLYFVFALLTRFQARDKPSSPAAFAEPAVVEVTCRDDAGRELLARSTVYGDISVQAPSKKPAKKTPK
jgi:hypothetical protein